MTARTLLSLLLVVTLVGGAEGAESRYVTAAQDFAKQANNQPMHVMRRQKGMPVDWELEFEKRSEGGDSYQMHPAGMPGYDVPVYAERWQETGSPALPAAKRYRVRGQIESVSVLGTIIISDKVTPVAGVTLTENHVAPLFSSVCNITCPPYGGSATLVAVNGNRGLVVSAAHVFEEGDRSRITCTFPSGERCRARLLGLARPDFAALVVENPPDVATPHCVRPARKEDGPFSQVGYPAMGQGRQMYVTANYLGYDNESRLHITGRSWSGFSGGALFNRYGEFVGTITGFDDESALIPSGPAMSRFIGRWMRVEE